MNERFLQVAEDLGRAVALDAHRIARGDRLNYRGSAFWIRPAGLFDPNGLILVMRCGDTGLEGEGLKVLLRLNFAESTSLVSFYAMLPGTDDLVRCMRIDLATSSDPARAILGLVESAVASVTQVAAALDAATGPSRDPNTAPSRRPPDSQ